MSARARPGPLSGVRVLDLGRFVAAPYCAMVLADLGAEVIRVERPGGDEDRRLGLLAANAESFTFSSLARSKLAITLDLRRMDAAQEVLCGLVSRSDVVVHNYGPEAARAFRVTYDDLRAMRRDLVYAAISSFGPACPSTGFDPMAQMGSGAGALSGRAGDPPLRAGVPWADYGTGLAAAVGVLAALRHRDLTGEGQAVDCSLLRTAVSFTTPAVAEAVVAGWPRPRLGNQAAYMAPANLYRCRDGHVYLAAVTSSAWRALAAVVGRPELAEAPELRTAGQRFVQRERIDPLIQAWAESLDVEEALAALDAAGVPSGPAVALEAVPEDMRVLEGRMLDHVDLGMPGLERVPVSVAPVCLSAQPPPEPTPPPRVGEHNCRVYGELLGYGAERIAGLQAAGLI